jgi:hypothetical protein
MRIILADIVATAILAGRRLSLAAKAGLPV